MAQTLNRFQGVAPDHSQAFIHSSTHPRPQGRPTDQAIGSNTQRTDIPTSTTLELFPVSPHSKSLPSPECQHGNALASLPTTSNPDSGGQSGTPRVSHGHPTFTSTHEPDDDKDDGYELHTQEYSQTRGEEPRYGQALPSQTFTDIATKLLEDTSHGSFQAPAHSCARPPIQTEPEAHQQTASVSKNRFEYFVETETNGAYVFPQTPGLATRDKRTSNIITKHCRALFARLHYSFSCGFPSPSHHQFANDPEVSQLSGRLIERYARDMHPSTGQDLSSASDNFMEALKDPYLTLDPMYDALASRWRSVLNTHTNCSQHSYQAAGVLIASNLAFLQFTGIYPCTHLLGIVALAFAMVATLHGYTHVLWLKSMHGLHDLLAWGTLAKGNDAPSTVIVTSTPIVWLAWAALLFIADVVAYVWERRNGPVTDSALLNLSASIIVTLVVAFAILCGYYTFAAQRHFGGEMNKQSRDRLQYHLERSLSHASSTSDTSNPSVALHPVMPQSLPHFSGTHQHDNYVLPLYNIPGSSRRRRP
ncbi:hypothetical protein CVT24_003043 [Panaeolus cyanescens]|uniref:Uncharacterized protein n=1 Tax=Panaeolus cyanescens TaxID=181874 RepID=A0A409VFR6_9AGAR|nr:hypothetical protein CVT24_003043 [Panaeolus cyanescens]